MNRQRWQRRTQRIGLATVALIAVAGFGARLLVPASPAVAAMPPVEVPQLHPLADNLAQWNDPVLNDLIADALSANTDLRMAAARIERVRGTGPHRPVSDRMAFGYETELLGRVAGGTAISQGDRDAVSAIIAADTVRAYVDAAHSSQRLRAAQSAVDLLDQSVRITTVRQFRGVADRLDVIHLSQLRDQKQADLPALAADRDAALLRLATLTGRATQDLPDSAKFSTATPEVARPVPVGDARTWLRRRPDVRAAEQRLAADMGHIGIATADLYPKVTLKASAGGPLMSWSFAGQQAIRARIDAHAESAADLALFDAAVRRAQEETETALAAYRKALLRQQALIASADAARRAVTASLDRHQRGEIDSLTLLKAQRTLARSEEDLAEATRTFAVAQVDLFRALRGNGQAPKA